MKTEPKSVVETVVSSATKVTVIAINGDVVETMPSSFSSDTKPTLSVCDSASRESGSKKEEDLPKKKLRPRLTVINELMERLTTIELFAWTMHDEIMRTYLSDVTDE